ncbi:MAG: ATP-binding protein, partial [Planctomycetaceae bacterium]|nr:ATP-binding protein [Planctomycetaceae bacterium]
VREQLSDLRQRIASQPSTTLFLVGPPGSGKSSVLAHLSSELTKAGVTVLGIKADQLPKQLNSLEDLSRLIFADEGERTRNIVGELCQLASHQDVVILIDQLDALANLADLESARLNVILELIGQLRGRGAIHIVASMRAYELRTDQRLKGLLEEQDAEPETIELSGLALTQVQQTLTANGVAYEHWPSDILEFLRVPYHLNVFLQHLELFLPTDRGRIPDATLFSSIQSMHAAKFDFTIGRSAHSASLEDAVTALVERIEKTESLWHAREEFQTDLSPHLHELESLGWVRFQNDQVGFAHQTQYEFLLGRRFVADPKAFVQYVGERKTGLFVRPTVWHTLALLRSVAQANYAVALSQLLAGGLPRHLRRLLMEFLSEVNQPTPGEISWVSAYLRKADTCITMCWLLRGKSEWFNSIPNAIYEHLMHHGGAEASWAVTRLLESSWSADTNRVTQLVRQHWAFRKEFATHVWWVVASAPHFSNELITWLHFCVDVSANGDHWFLHKSIESLNEKNPEASYRMIAKILDRRLDLAINGPLSSDAERYIWPDLTEPTNRAGKTRSVDALASKEMQHGEWHEITQFAAKDPKNFVMLIWPWFRRLVENLSARHPSRLLRYRSESSATIWLSDSDFRGSQIVTALLESILSWAKSSEAEFLQFIMANWHMDSMIAHRLFCRTLSSVAANVPAFILAYFQNDARRLQVGEYHSEESTYLITEIMPWWSETQIVAFQRFILGWHMYSDGGEQAYIDKYRGRILQLVPEIYRLHESTELIRRNQQAIEEEIRREEESVDLRVSKVESPISLEAMAKLSDNEVVVQIYRALTISDQTEFARHFEITASVLSGAFGKFAASNRQRAMNILSKLDRNRHESLAGAAIREIADTGCSSKELIETVQSLHQLGFVGQSFRDDAGYALRKLAITNNGLPDEICELLTDWLLTDSSERLKSEPAACDQILEQPTRDPESILWRHPGGFITLPKEWFWIGEAVKLGYSLRQKDVESAGVQKWFQIFKSAISIAFPVKVWEAWLYE